MEKHYAGFWHRFLASLIDAFIFAAVLFIPLRAIYGEGFWESDALILGFWDFVLSHLMPFAVTVIFWLRYKATPGKLLTKLEVVDALTGLQVRPGQAIIRYLGYIPSGLAFFIGFIWVAFDKRKQGWHDKLARTVVVRKS